MNGQRSIAATFAATMLLISLAIACDRDDQKAVKGPNGPAGSGRDTISDIALSEDGLGQVQIGMTLDDAVNMGLLNQNPNMDQRCDFVYPAVGSGLPEVAVMVVRGRIARIDVDTGAVTTEDGVKIGDSEDKVKSIYGDELKIEPHRLIDGGHYMTVLGDSASAGKALLFETDAQQRVSNFRSGRIPEVNWEGCQR
jgi:hypothetical protein